MNASSSSAGWQAPTPEQLDTLLTGYEVIAMLGRGGMGAVYRALQRNLDRYVAIKILPREIQGASGGSGFAERFQQEARSMAKLSHPAIIDVYDFGEIETDQGCLLYFVMEFVDGMDVYEYLKQQGGRLDSVHAHAIACHVLDALGYTHAYGIIHRDVKPANILLDRDGRVKVADFGLARATSGESNLTRTDLAMGTPDYIAPEALAGGSDVDGRADLYAVGAMLYQLLTGSVPRGMFQPASRMVPGLDARYDGIITRALQGDRKDRYQTAAEFRADLDHILLEPVPEAGESPQTAALKIADSVSKSGKVAGVRSASDAGAGDGSHASGRGGKAYGGVPVLKVGVIIVLLALLAWAWTQTRQPAPTDLDASVQPMVVEKPAQQAATVAEVAKTSSMPAPKSHEERVPVRLETVSGVVESNEGDSVVGVSPSSGKGKAGPESEAELPVVTAPEPEPVSEPDSVAIPGLQERLEKYDSLRRGEVAELAEKYTRALEDGLRRAARSGNSTLATAYRHEQARVDVFQAELAAPPGNQIAAVKRPVALSLLPEASATALQDLRAKWSAEVGKIDDRLGSALGQSLQHLEQELTRARAFESALAVVALREELASPKVEAPASLDIAQLQSHREIWAERLGVESAFDNSIGMALRLVPPGSFYMGCSDEQHAELARTEGDKFLETYAAERPRHLVAITRPFAMGACEVTAGQFRRFVDDTGYVTEFENTHSDRAWNRGLGYDPEGNHPVVCVTWADTVAFCNWLSAKEGARYRLPTEAEWEYACRAGTVDIWCGSRDALRTRAVVGTGRAAPVGGKRANALGFFDMQGNVTEWCVDRFAGDYYALSPLRDPAGPEAGEHRIVRGGSFDQGTLALRPGKRGWIGPGEGRHDRGFRVVREL
jgi:formylglycine-generating enzyme required for sulfatase activity/serine/threonine protein kinase